MPTISGVSTSTTAFLHELRDGPQEPVLVRTWQEFTNSFLSSTSAGNDVVSSYLPDSMYGHFANGGGPSYIVRVSTDSGRVAGYPG